MLSVNVTQLEESFRILFQNIDEAVIFFDQYGNIAQINSGVYNLFDIERSECTGNFLQNAIDGYQYDKEYTNHRFTYTKDSDRRYLLLSQSSIGDGNSALGKILLIRDITEQIESENELHRSQNLESLGQLAAGIAHDFNNYLAGITTSFSLARMEIPQSSELADIFAEGEKAALEASSLTRQLLTFSRGGAPVKETFAICDTLKEVGIFTTRGSNVKLQLDFPQNSPVINADKGQISQVFQNLILNAVQAMPQGGTITIGVKVHRSGKVANLKPSHYVAITVKDHGHGIPQDIISKIFDPYFTTKQKGSGLGLTTVFSIVKKHDGHITVSSSLGKGTVFTVYLPTTQEVKKKKETPATRPIPHDKGRILIMDDEAVVRKLLDKLLQRFGFEVDIAANGEEALDRFEKRWTKKETYTAVITDLTVSGAMGGLQLTKELLKREPSLKIIISSGYSEDEAISKYKDFGFFAALRKPFSIDELTAVLNSLSRD